MGLQGTLPGTQKVLCGRQLAVKARCSRSSRARQQTVMEATTKDKAKNQKLYREAVDVAEESDNTDCEVFVEPDGVVTQAMCCDYGFRSGVGRLYQGRSGEIPKNFFALGAENFAREFKQLRRSFRFNEYKSISEVNPPNNPLEKAGGAVASRFVGALATIDEKLEESSILAKLDPNPEPEPARQGDGELTSDCSDVRTVLKGLKLSNKKVAIRERAREEKEGKVEAPWPIKFAYDALCWSLDIMYNNRPVQRFWVLEVVARMPYFAYISMLHLYESLGWWRAGAELRKVHFAEEWNELHHLQIMESLGGDQLWWDRFLAQHAAVFYYWVLILFYTLAPRMAYVFSELVEHHATDTYAEFVVENEELLKSLPPPVVALEYYRGGDLYYFDNFQTSDRNGDPRRPTCRNLYEVFCNVRDDEQEHVKTMHACADYSIVEQIAKMKHEQQHKVRSPDAAMADTAITTAHVVDVVAEQLVTNSNC